MSNNEHGYRIPHHHQQEGLHCHCHCYPSVFSFSFLMVGCTARFGQSFNDSDVPDQAQGRLLSGVITDELEVFIGEFCTEEPMCKHSESRSCGVWDSVESLLHVGFESGGQGRVDE